MRWAYLLVLILLIPYVSAEVQTLPPVKLGSCADIVQLCSNCSFVNISVLQQPDKSKIVLNTEMQALGQDYFNFTFCNNSINGEIVVNGIADPDGKNIVWNYNYVVNPLGKVLTNSQAILYFLIFFLAFVFFVLTLVGAFWLPFKNQKDKLTGYILAVENLKYLKMFLFSVSYLLVMLMAYFGWMISFGYLDLDFVGTLFNFAFYSLVIALIPLVVVGTFVVIANLIRDSKVGKMLLMGLRFK